MSWKASWSDAIDWFTAYAADPAYSWAESFVEFMKLLEEYEATRGLYAHRWATTVVVSRFGNYPDWMDGPKLELLPLPGERLEVKVFDAYNKKVHRTLLHHPLHPSDLTRWLNLVAGEEAN